MTTQSKIVINTKNLRNKATNSYYIEPIELDCNVRVSFIDYHLSEGYVFDSEENKPIKWYFDDSTGNLFIANNNDSLKRCVLEAIAIADNLKKRNSTRSVSFFRFKETNRKFNNKALINVKGNLTHTLDYCTGSDVSTLYRWINDYSMTISDLHKELGRNTNKM